MELNLCLACDAFVKSNWTTCRACGHNLSSTVVEAQPVAAGHIESDSSNESDFLVDTSTPFEIADSMLNYDSSIWSEPIATTSEPPVIAEPTAPENIDAPDESAVTAASVNESYTGFDTAEMERLESFYQSDAFAPDSPVDDAPVAYSPVDDAPKAIEWSEPIEDESPVTSEPEPSDWDALDDAPDEAASTHQAAPLPVIEPDAVTPELAEAPEVESVTVTPALAEAPEVESVPVETPAIDEAPEIPEAISATDSAPPAHSRHDDDAGGLSWTPNDFTPPDRTYQHFTLASPTTQLVADLRSAADKVEALPNKWIKIMAAVGGAILLIIAIGSIADFTHSSNKSKLVDLKSTNLAKASTTTVTAVGSPGPSSPWVFYSDPGGRFSIEFPSQPNVQVSNTGDAKSAWQADTADGKSHAVVMTQNAGNGNVEQLLATAIQNDAQSLNATVDSKSVTTQNGHRQISAHMTTNQKHSVDATAFVQGGILYTVLVDSSNTDGDPTLFGHLTSTLHPLKS